ncbi:(2Fe-2S)-binding protein [Aneurinibacillus sp. REN35]
MRIIHHPIFAPCEAQEVSFTFAGKEYKALEGESIAAALLANGVRSLRYAEKTGEPRGLYCGIGHCYECRVYVRGVGSVRACVTLVQQGMNIHP